MEEIWKDIDEYYKISNLGNAASKERVVITPYRHTFRHRKWKERFLTIQIDKKGYARVKLHNKYVSLSHLVATAFLENPNNFTVVHHKDHNTLNNNVSNLEWVDTVKHNELHAYEKSIPVYQYTLGGKLVGIWPSASIAAKELGLNQPHIRECCIGIRKKHGGYEWSYELKNESNS